MPDKEFDDEYKDYEADENDSSAESSQDSKQKTVIGADIIRGHINTIILRTLDERDKYGYEIISEIQEKSHGQYELKQPTLYSALKRLENQGYITAYWKTDEISAGGRRKYYTLTDLGREFTERNRMEWEYTRTVIDSLISDSPFDFNNPAPSPVDFNILKKSTTRVPVYKRPDDTYTGMDGEPEGEEARTHNEKTHFNDLVDESTYSFDDVSFGADVTEIDSGYSSYNEAEEHNEGDSSEVSKLEEFSTPENDETYDYDEPVDAENVGSETPMPTVDDREIKDIVKEAVQQALQEALQEPAFPIDESIYTEEKAEEVNTDGMYPGIDSLSDDKEAAGIGEIESETTFDVPIINQGEPAIYDEPDTSFENVEKTHPQYDMASDGTEKISNTYGYDDEEARIRHENYLNLINRPVEQSNEENIVPGNDNIDVESLIYNNRPETERNYNHIIDSIYNQAITKPRQSVPSSMQGNAAEMRDYSMQAERQTQIPSQGFGSDARNDALTEQAVRDGLTIYEEDRRVEANITKTRTYDFGMTLFKSAAITAVYIFLISLLSYIFAEQLGVTAVYGTVILVAAVLLMAVASVIALIGIGKNSVRPITHRYISICVVLCILIIAIVCVIALLIDVDFSNAGDVIAKMVIPSAVFLGIPIFATSFYLMSK